MTRSEIEQQMRRIEIAFEDPRLSTVDQIHLCGSYALLQGLLDIAANQQPLGKEFSKVLHDNLEDLYES